MSHKLQNGTQAAHTHTALPQDPHSFLSLATQPEGVPMVVMESQGAGEAKPPSADWSNTLICFLI